MLKFIESHSDCIMVSATFLTTLLLAFAVAAKPVVVKRSPVTLALTRRLNLTSVHNLLRHDQTRAKFLKAKGKAKAAGIPFQQDSAVISSQVDNQAVDYIAAVGVGDPATTYQLIVDTGSANTWVEGYVPTSTSVDTNQTVGTEWLDKVTIAPGLVIPQQSICVVSESGPPEGGLGIGPVDLSGIPTVTDNLYSEGAITADEIGVSFEPITSSSGEELNGEITWGGVDSSKYTGTITYTDITSTSPSNEYWGINQSIKYGSSTILSSTAGIVDTGTTLILVATNAYNEYQSDTGATFNEEVGLLQITSSQYAALDDFNFVVGGVTFALTPNGQIWPRILNSELGGSSSDIFLIVGDIGSDSGTGLDFINGMTFLERFYAVFDTASQQVGLATTSYTDATTN